MDRFLGENILEEVHIVTATRKSEHEFWASAPLALSMQRLAFPEADCGFSLSLYFSNTKGLPDLYNEVLDADDGPDILLFMHDDAFIDDIFFLEKIHQGLTRADILGVVGNTRRVPRQPAWCFTPEYKFDHPYLSGAVLHGDYGSAGYNRYGLSEKSCELLDGVFLAVRRSVLRQAGVRFDPQFQFHFYDMDFCRSVRSRGLRMMTIPVTLTHQSGGGYLMEDWNAAYARYLQKWGS